MPIAMTEAWRYTPNNAVDYSQEDGHNRLQLIRERYDQMLTFWSRLWERARKEDKFVAGYQWDERIAREREESGRPMFTFNLLPTFERRIVNAARQARPQLRVKPVHSDKGKTPRGSNQTGSRDFSLADLYQGIWRHIEHISRADQAYDTALQHAVRHAFGYFALNTRESTHDPFVQELVIERIKDAYSVLLDPTGLEADYSDMADAFRMDYLDRRAFKKLYPETRMATIGASGGSPTGIGMYSQGFLRDAITIYTYWWVEYHDDEVIKMLDGRVHYLSDVEDVLDEWRQQGNYIDRDGEGKELRKEVKRPIAKWQRFTENEYLTGEMDTVFERIPIFPVLGDEIDVEGRVEYMSGMRDAMDAQRSYNYHRTAAIETVGLQPKAPFVMNTDQIRGHERMWEQANTTTMPYLLYNAPDADDRSPPPARQAPPQPAFAELNQAQLDAQDMQSIIGVHEAALGEKSNERSGRAVLVRAQQSQISTFHFVGNLGRAIEACGRVAVQAIPRIYDTERVVRIRLPDDEEDMVTINQSTIDGATGREVISNDIAYGKYDVVIDTGPAYQTQREEFIAMIEGLIQVLPPEALLPILHLLVEAIGFPGADKVSRVLRKMIPDQFKTEDEKAADLPKGVELDENGQPIVSETGEPWQPPLTPEQQLMAKQQELEQAKIEADVAKSEGDKAMAEAKVEQAKADLAEAQLAMAQLGAGGEESLGMADVEGAIDTKLEQHVISEKAHEDAIDAKLSELAADLVPAIRTLIDKKLEEAKAESEASQKEATQENKKALKESEKVSKEALKELETKLKDLIKKQSEKTSGN